MNVHDLDDPVASPGRPEPVGVAIQERIRSPLLRVYGRACASSQSVTIAAEQCPSGPHPRTGEVGADHQECVDFFAAWGGNGRAKRSVRATSGTSSTGRDPIPTFAVPSSGTLALRAGLDHMF